MYEESGGREGGGKPDPWHELVCLREPKGIAYQMEAINKGRNLMEGYRIEPSGLCPPNHLDDEDTLYVTSRIGFRYYFIRNGPDYFTPSFLQGLVSVPVIKYGDMKIISESKHERTKSPARTFNYDEVVERDPDELFDVLDTSISLEELPPVENTLISLDTNRRVVRAYKRFRDRTK